MNFNRHTGLETCSLCSKFIDTIFTKGVQGVVFVKRLLDKRVVTTQEYGTFCVSHFDNTYTTVPNPFGTAPVVIMESKQCYPIETPFVSQECEWHDETENHTECYGNFYLGNTSIYAECHCECHTKLSDFIKCLKRAWRRVQK